MKKTIPLLIISSTLILSSCGFNSFTPVESVSLKSISVKKMPDKTTYYVGSKFSVSGMEIEALYSNNTSKVVNNYTYAPNGALTLNDKEITITYTENDITASTKVAITVIENEKENDNIVFPSIIEGEVGENKNLYPELIVPAYLALKSRWYKPYVLTSNNFRFYSENNDIAGVDNQGKLTLYSIGETKIHTYVDENYNDVIDEGEKKAEARVVVSAPSKVVDTSKLCIKEMTREAYLNSSYSLNSFVLPSNATYQKVRYISEDSNIASVDEDGRVTTKNIGTVKIIAYNDKNNNKELDSDEKSTFAIYKVNEAATNKVDLIESTVNLVVGDTYTVNPTFTPALSSSASFDVSYSSSNEEVALVANGVVAAVKPGSANITINYKGATNTLKINVNGKGFEDNTSGAYAYQTRINEDNIVLNVNEKHTLKYLICPSYAIDEVTFLSSNEDVAEISSAGEITAKSSGNTIITVMVGKLKDTVLLTVKDPNRNVSEVPYSSYYGDLTWVNGEDLKTKLHNIISKNGYTPLKYASPTNWETNQYADEDRVDNSKVNAVYSFDAIDKTATNSGWQREHAFAASLMTGVTTGAAVTSLGRATDFHNLFAAYTSGNTSRGNKNYGNANEAYPGYTVSENKAYRFDRNNFEPDNEDKGRLARAIFYMAAMYDSVENANISESWTFSSQEDIDSHTSKSKTLKFTINESPIDVVENYVEYNRLSLNKFMARGDDSTIALVDYYIAKTGQEATVDYDEARKIAYAQYVSDYSTASIGNLSTLLEWNSYKVDAQEVQHNESVYSHVCAVSNNTKQGNRNPFVDYPELINYIYGDLKDQPGSLKQLVSSKEYVDMSTPDPIDPPPTPPGPIDPEELTIETCLYSYIDPYKGSGTTSSKEYYKTSDNINYNATLNGLAWNIVSGNDKATVTNDQKGTKFGAGSPKNCGTLTFETKDIFSKDNYDKITHVFLSIGTASSVTYKAKLIIGDYQKEINISGSSGIYEFDDINGLTGKVRIEFSDVSAAIYIKGIGIHAN